MLTEDLPKKTPPTTAKLLARADRASKHIGQLAHEIHRGEGELGIRRILGVMSLAKTRGVARVDLACKAALEMGAPTYRFVRRYLEHVPDPPKLLKQVDPLIRELNHYRDYIEHLTQQEPS